MPEIDVAVPPPGSVWPASLAALDPEAEGFPGLTNAELLALHCRPPDPPGVVFEEAVAYGTVGGRDLHLDLFRRADTTERAPAVVFIHGGAWGGGDPWFHLRHAHTLAGCGFVTATIRYRLSWEAPWPAALEDCKCAVRWLRANATEVGADPDRIAVAGGSAGGHLAALVALTPGRFEGSGGHDRVSSAPQAAVLWYPATDVEALESDPLVGAGVAAYFAGAKPDASPIHQVNPACPPILTITGGDDPLTTVALIERFHAALDEVGVENRLVVFEGRDHAFDLRPADWQASYDLLEAFLVERLKG